MSQRPISFPLRRWAVGVSAISITSALAGPVRAAPAPDPKATPAVGAPADEAPPLDPRTATSRSALTRAIAAYEYGEIEEMVAAARLVSEGRIQPVTPEERAQALRLVGIGLFLLDRREGAETTFYELLRLRPDSRLDPRTTRPDVVAFYEGVRQRHRDELLALQPAKRGPAAGWLVLLPPAGQFANGEIALGVGLATLEVASLATIVTTWVLFEGWRGQGDQFLGHRDDARTVRTANVVAWGVLAATLAYGVAEAALYKPPVAVTRDAGFAFEPGGLRYTF